MKPIKILFLSILFLSISSCMTTRQSYEFAHYGTESIKNNSNYKYVAQNVFGKAKTTIKYNVWKKRSQSMVTDGMLADAKSQLPALNNNQAYANFSVDVLLTEIGPAKPGGGIQVQEMVIEVVVSTDIIEYID